MWYLFLKTKIENKITPRKGSCIYQNVDSLDFMNDAWISRVRDVVVVLCILSKFTWLCASGNSKITFEKGHVSVNKML